MRVSNAQSVCVELKTEWASNGFKSQTINHVILFQLLSPWKSVAKQIKMIKECFPVVLLFFWLLFLRLKHF